MSRHKQFGPRTLARSQAMELLFQAEANGRTVEEVLDDAYVLADDEELSDYGRELALGADAMRHDLDLVIRQRARNWSLSHMPAVDRNLLRVALYEMLEEPDVDVAVTIDETVELAKAFGTDDSSRFVNGLLGRVVDDMQAGQDVIQLARDAAYGSFDEDGDETPEETDFEGDSDYAYADEADSFEPDVPDAPEPDEFVPESNDATADSPSDVED